MPTFDVHVSVLYRIEATTDVEALQLIGAARAADDGFISIGYSGVYEVVAAPELVEDEES